MRHFTEDEFKCPDCGQNYMNESFLENLDDAREYAGIPFVVTSGYRCVAHNIAVGGGMNSAHMKGLAADIACANEEERWQIIMGATDAGIDIIWIGKDHVHLDGDASKPHPCLSIEKGVL